jgi:hypothetical protein
VLSEQLANTASTKIKGSKCQRLKCEEFFM